MIFPFVNKFLFEDARHCQLGRIKSAASTEHSAQPFYVRRVYANVKDDRNESSETKNSRKSPKRRSEHYSIIIPKIE